MEQFSLEKYLENPQRKVVTRRGNSVRIICTDRKTSNSDNIIGLAKQPYDVEQLLVCDTDGRNVYKEIQNDLFFADEEEELTEFEKAMIQFSHERNSLIQFEHTTEEINAHLYLYSKKILDLARKEIEKKYRIIDKDDSDWEDGYKQGKKDTLKDLPKWNKLINGAQGSLNDNYLVRASYGHYFVCSAIAAGCEGCEYLDLTELENLPKEE